MNMLRDDALSISVCYFQCQVLSSTCTTIQIYYDATSCRLVKDYRRLVGQCLHLQPDLSKKRVWTPLARLFELEDEGTTSLLNVGTHLHRVQDFSLHQHCYDSLKPRTCTVFVLNSRYQLINAYRITYTRLV